MPAVKDVGGPGAGEPHARFDEAAGGIWRQWPERPHGAATSRQVVFERKRAILA
jgi:hypothetical protein